jgi:hypothetical protein
MIQWCILIAEKAEQEADLRLWASTIGSAAKLQIMMHVWTIEAVDRDRLRG